MSKTKWKRIKTKKKDKRNWEDYESNSCFFCFVRTNKTFRNDQQILACQAILKVAGLTLQRQTWSFHQLVANVWHVLTELQGQWPFNDHQVPVLLNRPISCVRRAEDIQSHKKNTLIQSLKGKDRTEWLCVYEQSCNFSRGSFSQEDCFQSPGKHFQ
jgi:hypothetical protein